jgi:threonyl-tRNA synthetase
MIAIKLPDGSVKEYPEGVRPKDVAEGIGKRLAEAAVAAVANGTIVDMDRPLEDGQGPIELRLLTNRDREALDVLRHSTAHVMARAIMRLFPGVKLAFGPTTANGFYYDVDLPDRPLSEDDFPAIEAEMARVIKDAEPFERFSLPVADARKFVGDLGQGYKVEHIDDELHKYGVLSFYRQGEFVDLCRGPHIPHAGKVGAFKLLSIAGAYWKGHTDRKMLQRVYGTAFFDKKELDAHLSQVEEAKKRDHRKLGKELGLFTISPMVGSGLVLWMPKGAIIRGLLESFLKDELMKRGYQPVYTPHIGKIELYQTSGHYPYYKDSQFPPIRLLSDAAMALVDGLEKGTIDDDGQRKLLRDAGIPERGIGRDSTSYWGRARRLRRGVRRERGVPPQADELPPSHPDLRRPAAELSRPAGEARRVRHGLPLRAIGRAVGDDPRPRLHPGRRPPVLYRGSSPRRVPGDDGVDAVRPE